MEKLKDSHFVHFFEDETKIEVTSEIWPHLKGNAACLFEPTLALMDQKLETIALILLVNFGQKLCKGHEIHL